MSALKQTVVDIQTYSKSRNPMTDVALPLVELKQVCKSYGEGSDRVSILKDINLSIKAGEFIAIVGFSGSGKTTLISTIAGLIDIDSGEVLKQGQPIIAPGPDRGVVFQNYSFSVPTLRSKSEKCAVKPHVGPVPCCTGGFKC